MRRARPYSRSFPTIISCRFSARCCCSSRWLSRESGTAAVLGPALEGARSRLFRHRLRRVLLSDLALELERLDRQVVILRLHEEGIEATAVIDRLKRVGRHAQLDRAAERVRDHRDVEQVGQKAPLGLDIRVADLVSDLSSLAG